MPLLGGLTILAGVVVASVAVLDVDTQLRGVLAGAALVTLVGAVDDKVELGVMTKLLGQIAAAVVPAASGVLVTNVTIPFLGPLDLGHAGGPLTVVEVVAVMNIVNFSDGIDGLAAGVCAIAGAAFAVIAFDLGRYDAGVLAAIIAGAAVGFLFFTSTRRPCSWAMQARCCSATCSPASPFRARSRPTRSSRSSSR